jgi:PKD repeat protein
MVKKLGIAAVILAIASFAGLSIGTMYSFGIDNSVTQGSDRMVLHGNVHPKARPEFDEGPTDPSLPMNRMILLLKMDPEKKATLNRLLAEQQAPSSQNYHRWLTPEEFGQRFGRTPEEIATVKSWLITQGFTIDEEAKGGTWINFSGKAADVERAFQTSMHEYRVDGNLHHANSTDPSIPRMLADLVAGPVTLHNFLRKPSHSHPRPGSNGTLRPDYNESDGSHDLAPGDFSAIYDVNNVYNLGYDGTGVTIAIVGRTYPAGSINKWNTFRSFFLLSDNPPVVTVNGPNPGDVGSSDDTEADLDVEWSGAVAKGATINFVTSQTTESSDGVDLSAQYIVDNNLAPIMSESFDTCESQLGTAENDFYSGLWQQASSQGITVFVASGDNGAYDCTDNSGYPMSPQGVNGLASTPYNVAVGGTQFNTASSYWSASNEADGTSVLEYIPETAWNDTEDDIASGGGASTLYPKPAWQAAPGVPKDGWRDVPDVALNADDLNIGYRVYTCNNDNGSACNGNDWYAVGGTSAGAPSFAGIMALVVQSMGGERQGNVNTTLYQLGNAQYSGTSGASAVFHDITSGNNSVTTRRNNLLTGYSCTTGYDQVTGLGSVDATNLLLAFQAGGLLTVTIDPAAAVTAGAEWQVDRGAWKTSGSSAYLDPGQHTVAFNTITGWNTPASQTVNISAHQPTSITGTYTAVPSVAGFTANVSQGTAPLTVNFTDQSTGAITSWLWNFGDGRTGTTQNPSHIYAAAGVYSVTLTVNGPGGQSTSQPYTITVYATPSAAFTASTSSGIAPLPVAFTDKSTGSVTGWSWNFGDGVGTSTLQNPTYTYQNGGIYTVTLTVTGPVGSSTKTQTVTVYATPVAAFTASTNSGLASLPVSFTDQSTPSGSITKWSWNFGDGKTSTSENPSHTYTKAGNYTVSLTVTGPGGTSTATQTIAVYTAPKANFKASVKSGTAPLTVQFTDESTGGITGWSWDFGDGQTSTDQNPSHAYTAAGTYTVTLTVTNPGGPSKKTMSNYITVYAPANAAFTATPAIGLAPLAVSFTDQSTGTISKWKWSFGDGKTSTSQNPTHTYSKGGLYSVTLTVSGHGGTSTLAQSNLITVNVSPNAGFAEKPATGKAPLTVSFIDNSTGTVTSWLWNFGDGQTSTEQNPSHTYETAGTYNVTLQVTGPYGTSTKLKEGCIKVSK